MCTNQKAYDETIKLTARITVNLYKPVLNKPIKYQFVVRLKVC